MYGRYANEGGKEEKKGSSVR
uniref:Uncharacterized protein n=1 Tax=Rhizophora mucronata TaxID=61149 RepID=A0A2P2N8J6_RHIMU